MDFKVNKKKKKYSLVWCCGAVVPPKIQTCLPSVFWLWLTADPPALRVYLSGGTDQYSTVQYSTVQGGTVLYHNSNNADISKSALCNGMREERMI